MNPAANTPAFRGELRRNEPMSRHTSWRVGGPADIYFKPASIDDLSRFLRTLDDATPILWLGLGSNLLVRDGGIRGAVIATHGVLDGLERLEDGSVDAGAGVACARLAKQCVRWGLGPAHFFAGIPGTLGGALAMNAGAFGGETWDHVIDVEVIDRHGNRRRRDRSDYEVGYRTVQGPPDEWFVSARLGFQEDADASADAIREVLAQRKASQPIGEPSCGSVFTNPPGDHAARLIEATGLKGERLGGAMVSDKHANFIVNTGSATAADMEALINRVREEVLAKQGVRLETEVRIVGERG